MATILGLLLVVTVVADYITTTLPNQMSVNDLSRGVLVQNQVGRFQTVLHSVGVIGARGGEISQPISLGSDGAPPFAAPDGGTILPAANGTSVAVDFTLLSPAEYLPPSDFPSGGSSGGCSYLNGIMNCGTHANPYWNFTSCPATGCIVSEGTHTDGTFRFGVNNSSIAINANQGYIVDAVDVFGNNNTITISGGGSFVLVLDVVGDYNHVTSVSSTGGSSILIWLIGTGNTAAQTCNGNCTLIVNIFGSDESFDGYNEKGASSSFTANVWGFNDSNPISPICPYGNLANTDTLNGSGSGKTSFNATYHTTGYTGNSTQGPWTNNWNTSGTTNCPDFFQLPVNLDLASGATSGFLVDLRNTYSPTATVAYDAGSVIYAQSGGYPIMQSPPAITYAGKTVFLWFPGFVRPIAGESGIGTAEMLARLSSINSMSFSPSTAFSIFPGTNVSIVIHTQFAMAWLSYYNSTAPFAGRATCTGPAAACIGPYEPGGPLGTVTIALPATSVAVTVASYDVDLTS